MAAHRNEGHNYFPMIQQVSPLEISIFSGLLQLIIRSENIQTTQVLGT